MQAKGRQHTTPKARAQEISAHTHANTIHDTDGLTFTRRGCLQGCSSSKVLTYSPILPPPSPSLPAAPGVAMTLVLFPSLREMRSTKRPIDLFADGAGSPTEVPGAAVPATLSCGCRPLGMLRDAARVRVRDVMTWHANTACQFFGAWRRQLYFEKTPLLSLNPEKPTVPHAPASRVPRQTAVGKVLRFKHHDEHAACLSTSSGASGRNPLLLRPV